jgi:hypothetical protein
MTQLPASSPIAGAVLPLGRAEQLIATLQSVVSVRIVAGENGVIDAIHVLVSGELTPKQVVRNIESALMAHLGMKVDHRKISVATSIHKLESATPAAGVPVQTATQNGNTVEAAAQGAGAERRVYFEDLEVRGSRATGSTCKVTLRRGDATWIGEADGAESSRTRIELAARAALTAIRNFEGNRRSWELVGVRRVEAFETAFVFVGVETWIGRDRTLLTGSCEIRDSAETSAVLAILDATNRWLGQQNDM